MLLALLDDPDAAMALRGCKADIDKLRDELVAYIESELESIVSDSGEAAKPTAGFQRVMQRAVNVERDQTRDVVTGADVLLAIFSEPASHAVSFLQRQGLSYGVVHAAPRSVISMTRSPTGELFDLTIHVAAIRRDLAGDRLSDFARRHLEDLLKFAERQAGGRKT